MSIVDWLGSSGLSIWIQNAGWVVPLLQSIHILALSILFGSVLMITLRTWSVPAGPEFSLPEIAARYAPWIWWSLGVLVATGLVMIVAEPYRELLSPVFWAKMVCLAAVVLATLGFQRRIAGADGSLDPKSARSVATITLAIWIVIMILGRWIAYI